MAYQDLSGAVKPPAKLARYQDGPDWSWVTIRVHLAEVCGTDTARLVLVLVGVKATSWTVYKGVVV